MTVAEHKAFVEALTAAPRVEVDVNPMTGVASVPYPSWLFEAGVAYGRKHPVDPDERDTP